MVSETLVPNKVNLEKKNKKTWTSELVLCAFTILLSIYSNAAKHHVAENREVFNCCTPQLHPHSNISCVSTPTKSPQTVLSMKTVSRITSQTPSYRLLPVTSFPDSFHTVCCWGAYWSMTRLRLGFLCLAQDIHVLSEGWNVPTALTPQAASPAAVSH